MEPEVGTIKSVKHFHEVLQENEDLRRQLAEAKRLVEKYSAALEVVTGLCEKLDAAHTYLLRENERLVKREGLDIDIWHPGAAETTKAGRDTLDQTKKPTPPKSPYDLRLEAERLWALADQLDEAPQKDTPT
jgi:hypothetical protein